MRIPECIPYVIVVLLISLAGNVYLYKELDKKTTLFTSQLEQQNEETKAQFQVLDTIITSSQNALQSSINALEKKFERAEEESQSKFSEIQDTVKGLSVTSGDFSDIIDEILPSVISVVTDTGQGSGAIIDQEGYVVTAHHVIKKANAISVIDKNRHIYAAQLIGYDPQIDIAVLKIDGKFEALHFGDSENIRVGEKVIAIGNPAGLGFSVTEGIVSQVNRMIVPGTPPLIQIDVPINPGNSGGPLVNKQGLIIGINKLKIAGYESLGFAVPSAYVKPAIESIIGRNI